MAAENSKRMVKLKSAEGEIFEVAEDVASESRFVKNMIEDVGIGRPFPLLSVTSTLLPKVIEYIKYHVESRRVVNSDGDEEKPATPEDVIAAWDAEFMKVDQKTLYNLIMAANYMDIPSLLDLGCQTVANMISGKTAEQVRKTFKIKNDFTAEEEEEIRRENAWAFQETN